MLIIITILVILSPSISSIYQSHMDMSSLGKEFQPRNLAQLILQTTTPSRFRCSAACNQRPSCRAFDYDSVSRRCRLFEGDLMTGSIVLSASATSSVGIVTVLASMFSTTHNQSCSTCQESRYETCSAVTSRCQCGPHTFWDGSQCSLQQFEGGSCSQVDECREDLNLTCAMDYSGILKNCSLGTYMLMFGLYFLAIHRQGNTYQNERRSDELDEFINAILLFMLFCSAFEVWNDEQSQIQPHCIPVE